MGMLTTRRSMVPAHRPASLSRNRCLHVWMTSPRGREATDYSSTPVRQRCVCATGLRQHQIPHHPVRIGDDWIFPADSVRNLVIYLDSDASMRVHVSKTVSNCFAALRQIRSIRSCVPRQVLVSLVISGVVVPRLRQRYPSRSSRVPQQSAAVRTER